MRLWHFVLRLNAVDSVARTVLSAYRARHRTTWVHNGRVGLAGTFSAWKRDSSGI